MICDTRPTAPDPNCPRLTSATPDCRPHLRRELSAAPATHGLSKRTISLTVVDDDNAKGAPAQKQVRPLRLRVLESYQLRQLRPQRGDVLRKYNASRGAYGRKTFGMKI